MDVLMHVLFDDGVADYLRAAARRATNGKAVAFNFGGTDRP